jgi:glycolate oxidase
MHSADIRQLGDIVGSENVRSQVADCYVYGSDSSVHEAMPWVIVRPASISQVQEVMRFANPRLIPVVPRGAGSGMSGQAVPIKGGIIMDLKLMNKILEINLEDTYVRVEPGVVDDDLNRALKPYGMFYPPAPASSRVATIGGEIANNASGVRSVKYGATRDSVLALKVVLANGDIITCGARTRVQASGYQLDRLMVGSEGTLGIIVEAILKVIPIPKYRCMAVAKFHKLEDAGNAISKIMAKQIDLSLLELMDNIAITAVNKTLNLGLPDVEAILLFEADGMFESVVDCSIEAARVICEENQAFGFEKSYDSKERTRIFAGRKQLFPALSNYSEYFTCASLADDMAVPYSKMALTARKIHEIAKRNNVIMTAYGHCGSGCMHTKILLDPKKESQWEDAKRAVFEIYEFVRSVGGSTSAEHGIGISKAPAFMRERSDSLTIMRAIKRAFDPNNVLNPGKLMDAPTDWVTATALRYRVKM